MCKHPWATLKVTIWQGITAVVQLDEIADVVDVQRDAPEHVHIEVWCPDCEKQFNYNAWAHQLSLAGKWPAWLLNRLVPLRAQHPALHAACRACGVGPADHPLWL